jgi:hypothetical protein
MTEVNGNGTDKLLVQFMGGSVVIKPGGSFKNNSGELVEYSPCVDLSAVVDSKQRADPGVFKNMIDALSKHPEAMKKIQSLSS